MGRERVAKRKGDPGHKTQVDSVRRECWERKKDNIHIHFFKEERENPLSLVIWTQDGTCTLREDELTSGLAARSHHQRLPIIVGA